MSEITTRIRAGHESQPAIGGTRDATLVQIYGQGIGRTIRLAHASISIGRAKEADVVIHSDDVSRLHCRIRSQDGEFVLEDAGSTNGTFVNNTKILGVRRLLDGDMLKMGGEIFRFLSGDNIEQLYIEEIHRLAIIDGLTGIHNRRHFSEVLENEIARCERQGHPLSLLLLDLDHFKAINDELGHLAGDAVLRTVAERISEQCVRREDCFARYGGEEFALLVTNTTKERAKIVAERILAVIRSAPVEFEDHTIDVRLSIGLAAFQSGQIEKDLVGEADRCLYEAKSLGRDRFCS